MFNLHLYSVKKVSLANNQNIPESSDSSPENIVERELNFHALFTAMTEGVAIHQMIYDANGKAIDYIIRDVNPSFEKNLGIPADKAKGALGSQLFRISPPPYIDIYEHVLKTGEPYYFTTYFQPLERHFEISVFIPREDWFATVFLDITGTRHAIEELRLASTKYRRLYESMMDGFARTNMDGDIKEFNPYFREMLGYSESELLQLSNQDITPESWHEYEKRIIRNQVIPNGYSGLFEKEYRKKDGTVFPVELRISLIRDETGNPDGMWAVIRDITKRKVAEINLQRKLLIEKIVSAISARLVNVADFDQAIFDSLKEIRSYSKARTVFILIKNKQSKTIRQIYTWNEQGQSNYLYKQYDKFHLLSEWFFIELGEKHELFIHDTSKMTDDLEQHRTALKTLGIRSLLLLPIIGKGEVVGSLGLDNIEHPGLWTVEEFNLLITLSNLFSNAFHRRTAEQDLIESEEIHRVLLDATREGIIIIDRQGRIAEVSNITLEIFKAVSREEIIGRRFLEFIPEELRKNKGALSTDKVWEGITQTLELTLLRNDGSRFAGEVNISLLRKEFEETKGYLVVIRDISERKKMDKQLIHTERMAGIGLMAAGMAHEINQPLNNISLSMDNLILSMSNGVPEKEYVENKTGKIFDNITRIRNIIDHVRAFSKDHDDYIQSKFNINESIRNAKSMISEQFKHKGIHLVLSLDGTIPQIVGNTYKFEQVIVNMIINAKDAIEEKEKLLDKEFTKVVEISSSREDSTIIIEVKDNGIGIESNDIDKVMLPFYSTKKEGVGTGLGLSISFGIIRDMTGTIEIQSQKLTGTTFRIKIPFKKEVAKQPYKS